ncbi:regulator [Clostridioides difficile]|uniref:regulator n=1 Tax=Clostridioides difficile TaxID=1496 RepID=UPI000938FC52|nr:regulator [Clostridioides difficile]EGT2198866.1 regulator [Clostridioides difficile]EGT4942973.1 regulator [Clostridioides difficile]MDF3815009.1 regulator [Clostridioides difficile]HBF4284568.1 regulator [Clostridioides difficile]HBF5047428.1 regulator [Clostridioides difficile]
MALEVKIEVKTIKDVVILNSTDWKKETSLLTVKIARGQGDLSYIKYFTNES